MYNMELHFHYAYKPGPSYGFDVPVCVPVFDFSQTGVLIDQAAAW